MTNTYSHLFTTPHTRHGADRVKGACCHMRRMRHKHAATCLCCMCAAAHTLGHVTKEKKKKKPWDIRIAASSTTLAR